jgi:hypothetical protein
MRMLKQTFSPTALVVLVRGLSLLTQSSNYGENSLKTVATRTRHTRLIKVATLRLPCTALNNPIGGIRTPVTNRGICSETPLVRLVLGPSLDISAFSLVIELSSHRLAAPLRRTLRRPETSQLRLKCSPCKSMGYTNLP